MNNYIIRNETKEDRREVENLNHSGTYIVRAAPSILLSMCCVMIPRL